MEIGFIEPSEADVVRIYEDYRMCNEPDSPVIPFASLAEERRLKIAARLKVIERIVLLDKEKAGFITIVDEEAGFNFGFGLFKEFRGRGLMARIIRAAGVYLKVHCQGKPVTAATRKENTAAIRSLLAGGFVQIGYETKPPCGTYAGPVEYVTFKWNRDVFD
ncbi:MAG: hypothetical protein NTY45_12125 [Elusimicrobia bacterium]|nr:hypothetical protein [Elusimicrobiota bacterium]